MQGMLKSVHIGLEHLELADAWRYIPCYSYTMWIRGLPDMSTLSRRVYRQTTHAHGITITAASTACSICIL